MKFEFSQHIFQKFSHIKFHEILLVGDGLCHADGQTHMTKLTVAFLNFAKESKKTKPLTHLTAGVTTYQ